MPKLLTGAEIVFKCLEDQKVEHIFGYPGGAVLPIYDELKNHPSIKHILVDTSKVQVMQLKVMLDHLENQV
jgi:acetolactate synthase-1/2/3 large subunit